jgi:hypothetical protein
LLQCRNEIFFSAEEVFLIHWGILPTLKGLPFERLHE